MVKERERLTAKILTPDFKKQMREDFTSAQRKILFLDYDGTLVPFVGDPQDAVSDDALLKVITALLSKPETDVIIISGRTKDILEKWFGLSGAALVAEHGVWIKHKEHEWGLTVHLSNEWKQQALPLFTM